MYRDIVLLPNRSGRYFAEDVLEELHRLGKTSATVADVEDREFKAREGKSIIFKYREDEMPFEGKDTYVIQFAHDWVNRRERIDDTLYSVADNFMYLCTMLDIAKRNGADEEHTTAVIPEYFYGRQDKEFPTKIEDWSGRIQIDCTTAGFVPKILKTLGAGRILTMSAHSDECRRHAEEAGIKFHNLQLRSFLPDYIIREYSDIITDNLSVVPPDPGARDRAEYYARYLGRWLYGDGRSLHVPEVEKRRDKTKEGMVIGIDIKGRVKENVLITEDMICSGGTFKKAVAACCERGAKSVYGICTHPIFSGDAKGILEKLYDNGNGVLKKVFTANTVLHDEDFIKNAEYLKVFNVAESFARGIRDINEGVSV